MLPRGESLRLLAEKIGQFEASDIDLGFLFACLGLRLLGEDELAVRPEGEYFFAELAEILFERAFEEAMAPVLGVAGFETDVFGTLPDDPGTRVALARFKAGVGPDPTLYILSIDGSQRALEVVVKPGRSRVARLDDSAEAITAFQGWLGAR